MCLFDWKKNSLRLLVCSAMNQYSNKWFHSLTNVFKGTAKFQWPVGVERSPEIN